MITKRISNSLIAAIVVGSMAGPFSHQANATVTGSLTAQNGTTGVIPGSIRYNGCQNSVNVVCAFPLTLTTGSSGTATVVNNKDTASSHFGNTDIYIQYYSLGDYPGVTGLPSCTWHVQVTSDQYAHWSGMVHTILNTDAGYNNNMGYTPTCSYSNFSVNYTMGTWTLNINWSK